MAAPTLVGCQVEGSVDSGAQRLLPAPELRPGDLVRVRAAKEIAYTLDADGRLRGCAFARDMLAHCGQERRVLQPVAQVYDEHRKRMLRVHHVVLLEGSTCDGSAREGGCDYACHHLWRTEWLEKLGERAPVQLTPPTRDEPLEWRIRRLIREARSAVGALRHPQPKIEAARGTLPPVELQPGDWVRVRTEAEIRSSLDALGRLKGCTFTWTQYGLCGQSFRVLSRVDHFYDVAKARMAKTRNTVLLEGVYCHGADLPEANGCERRCHYFWRTEWLEKLPPPDGQ